MSKKQQRKALEEALRAREITKNTAQEEAVSIVPRPKVKPPKQEKHANNISFVLGNGCSRLSVDPTVLLGLGTVYGCNAQYREYEPHYLIAVDVKMVNEVIASGYHNTNQVWTNTNKGITSKTNIHFFTPHKGWSSGPTALWFAATHQASEIYILGFDFQGINGKFNNVYADTFNYKKSTDSATYHGNWLSQTEKVIKEYRNIKFFRVIEPGSFIPDRLGPMLPNLSHITYEEFGKKFPGTIYSDQNDQKTTI